MAANKLCDKADGCIFTVFLYSTSFDCRCWGIPSEHYYFFEQCCKNKATCNTCVKLIFSTLLFVTTTMHIKILIKNLFYSLLLIIIKYWYCILCKSPLHILDTFNKPIDIVLHYFVIVQLKESIKVIQQLWELKQIKEISS